MDYRVVKSQMIDYHYFDRNENFRCYAPTIVIHSQYIKTLRSLLGLFHLYRGKSAKRLITGMDGGLLGEGCSGNKITGGGAPRKFRLIADFPSP